MKISEAGKLPTSKRTTSYSSKLTRLIKSTGPLENSLPVGSKRRLTGYQKDLSVSRGIDKPQFDDKLRDVIFKYCYDRKEVVREIEYLNSLRDDDGYRFSRNLKLYSATEDAMIRFSQPDYTSFRWNEHYQHALEELKKEFRGFHLKPIFYKSDDDVKDILPKANSHSGYYYIESGKRHKGECMDGILPILEEAENRAVEEGSFKRPILINFRTQGSGEYDDDGTRTYTCKHKTRVISMIDLLWTLSEFRYLKPLQARLAREDFYAGGKDDSTISSFISNWRVQYSRFMSLDYSSYDQTISGWLLEDVYDILECAFDMSDYERSLWKVLKHDAVHKDFILSEGILHSDKGVASGQPSTQVNDTIANRLIAMTFFYSIGAKFNMMAMGDDNIIFTNADVNIKLFASYVMKNFGMVVNTDDKSSEGTRRDIPKFLSRYWTSGGPYRHKYQILSRMLFPERFREYNNEVTPELVLYAYILTYPRGIDQLIDVQRFKLDNPSLNKEVVWKRVDSRYLPGILAYSREYLSDKVDGAA